MKKIRLTPQTILRYFAVLLAMASMNFVLPMGEPLSFALYYATLFCNFNPFVMSAFYLACSATALSVSATLSAAVQAMFLLLVCVFYRKLRFRMGYERIVFALLAQLPFIFLFPHGGYAVFPFPPVLQKLLISCFLILLSIVCEGGMSALLFRAFRSRLSTGELCELALMWLFIGMGVYFALGLPFFYLLSLTLLVGAVTFVKTTAVIPFATVLSLPLTLALRSPAPIAAYTIFSCVMLLFLPYGKTVSVLSLLLTFAGTEYLNGTFSRTAYEIVFTMLSCALPVLLSLCLPDKFVRRINKSLLFYREHTLPRIAVNRNRRAVGEQLFEVSALFRDIENAFNDVETPTHVANQICEKLKNGVCKNCANRRACEASRVFDSFEKLVAVGRAKGRVNLIDLPCELAAHCSSTSGLLFSLNNILAEYARVDLELGAAREGRKLLAEQAHGVSEVLKDIALSESEEFVFSEEENRLAETLAKEGILSSEIFLYGEEERFTATLTLDSAANGKRVCKIASEALGIPLTLAEKLPLTQDRACFVFKRKANFDASFGVAACKKDGELTSGDTHSILKIDERRFLTALSDGMGSGEEARAISDRTISLLESFYKAKMPSDTVMSTVNSLVAFSSEERFACLDVAAVNLDTGIADVVKIGSPVGFVLSGETLEVLEGDSLPIGVLETVHPVCLRVEMKADDFLIFMSDGITSAFGSSSDLCAYLSRLHPLNPQSLAEEILENALKRYHGHAEDDMTVLTVKLTKSA